ncbi:MAG: YceI family protein [Actinobacteria bacterium]|nr:YceI family protein [Actinomycetota bacterium]
MKPVFRNVLAGAVVVAVGVVAGPWIYINLIVDDAPEALTLEPIETTIAPETTTTVGEVAALTTIVEVSTTTIAPVSNFDGNWSVATKSVVGYRAKEVLFGQNTEGVGRTSAVTGKLKIDKEKVVEAEFTVDMASIKSDSTRRDAQVNGRILDTVTYPTAKFVLSKPIALTPEAFAGSDIKVDTTGSLTLRGVTKDVSFTLVARLVDDVIEVNGSIQIVFADFSIPDPSLVAIIVEDRGLLEFLLRFTR